MKRLLLGLALAGLVGVACNSKSADAKQAAPAPAAASNSEQTAAKTYVCPMHEDVTDTKPSKCPKCGMTLELKK